MMAPKTTFPHGRARLKDAPQRILVANWMVSPSAQRLLDGIQSFAREHGLAWDLEALPMQQTDTMRLALEAERPDGVITGFASQPVMASLMATSMPTVFLRYGAEEPPTSRRRLSVLRLDFGDVGRAAARHLLERGGFRSFGFVEATQDPEWSASRGEAFREAVARTGRPFFHLSAAEGVYQASVANRRELSALADWLRTLPKPAGIFAATDERARDTLLACREAGLEVPQAVSVLGVNNDAFFCRHVFPNLTSVAIDHEKVGRAAAAELARLLEQRRPRRQDFAVPVLAVEARASTAPASQGGPLVRRALDWIEAHACEGASAADVARALRASRSLLGLRFRELGAGTVLGALTDRRLREVQRLLRETNDRIETICDAAGFGDAAGLRRLFRRRYGCSMREWRRNHP
jgi:LacI family transcriptional regulator